MKNDPAFPHIATKLERTIYDDREEVIGSHVSDEQMPGLTKRELFAAMAMAASMSNPNLVRSIKGDGSYDIALARNAVSSADALILALETGDGKSV